MREGSPVWLTYGYLQRNSSDGDGEIMGEARFR